ncbi:FN3 associated domain-containing protein, partial [Paramuribaculum intestinale]|uniref:FN3 associated domain-containing protein n=1 Tax=Paramuribaculum intestinale TaxID=2094151 RepID=UPI00272F7D1C
DGSVSIDVNEMTAVPSYPSFDDYNYKFVFNDAPYNHYNDPQYNNFLDYFKVDVRGPDYLTAYYRFATTEEGLADAPEMKFDESRTAKFSEAGYIDVYTCNPGKRGLFHDKVRKFNKIATVAPSLSDILDAEESNEIARYHLTGSLLITGTAQYEYHETDAPDITKIGYIAMATDADGRHVRILFQDAYKFIPEVGQHIADFGLAQTTASFFDAERTHRKYNLLATSNIKPFKPFEPEAGQEIAMPRSIARTAIDAADKSRRVRLIDMKIGGNATDGYTLTPADGTEPIRLNNVLYWTPADGFDPDAEYAVEGYVMPAKPAEATASLTAKAGTEEMEFWPLSEEKKRQTDTPELLVSGYESADGDSYVAVEPVTLTATVEGRDADAPIEYSTDGGATWITMTDGKLTIDHSAKVDVRAHFPGFSPSETVSVEIKREYYSAEAVITPDQRGGYTTVTFAPGENAADGTDFTVYYTLDGSEPDMKAAKFTPGMKPLELTEAATVKALMIEQGKRPAKTVASQALTVRANDLDITADKGEGFTTVAIAPKDAKHVDPKAEIRYTTDGTEPTASSQLYKGEFEVEAADNGMTIKAICIEPGKTAGNVASATVAVEGLRPSCDVTISYTEADGVYTITLTAPAGKIFYALND